MIASGLLAVLVRVHGRLQQSDETASLHDARVALRRLRTWLRAMRPVLDDTVRPRIRRRLRDLARATSRARDLEVLLAWRAGKFAPDHEETAVETSLRGAWHSTRDAAVAEARADLAAQIPKIAGKLERQLSHYRLDVRIDRRAEEPTMAVFAADVVRVHAVRLRNELSAVRGPDDVAAAHRARISEKRLRYLLESLAPMLPDARALVRRLSRIQDALGCLHDAHIATAALEEHLRDFPEQRDAGRPLLEAACGDVERAYARVEREFLGDRAESLVTDALALAAAFSQGQPRVEIERKFLLSHLPPIARRSPSALIEQGYLPGAVIEERLRRTTIGGESRFERTVKIGSGLERVQIEEALDAEQFRPLWRLTRGRRVRKRRYYVPDGTRTWEIDRFRDPALIVAEVELAGAGDDPSIPPWLEAVLVREVTNDPAYSNASLAH